MNHKTPKARKNSVPSKENYPAIAEMLMHAEECWERTHGGHVAAVNAEKPRARRRKTLTPALSLRERESVVEA